MGHKVHPTGFRLGIVTDWTSTWFANTKNYADYLNTDLKVRDFLKKKLAQASVSRIQIERPARNARITIHTARPGIVIGKKGEDIESLRKQISVMMGVPVHVSVEEIRKPELDAYLVAESVAQQLERRIMFRRAMKRAVTNAMRIGGLGVKINVSGRLNGGEIARSEWYREGRVPLHTLRANIDYGFAEARTTYGVIGVKVWIFKGEAFGLGDQTAEGAPADKAAPHGGPSRHPASRDTDASLHGAVQPAS
ncbi:MAG: 30S ribosomal protein S3 [Gammaproteobacteria bacterium]|nr:30S ribosomal protein S3 [Gammaproteobacteria bacterium]